MLEYYSLSTSVGNFSAHCFIGKSKHLLVFIPGLMEPKAGFFYIWNEMAHDFHEKGNNCLQFDLAGQGDSLLPLSFDLWNQQINAILNLFHNYQIHFITRGLGTILLTPDQTHITINPSLFEPVARQLALIRWKKSPLRSDFLNLEDPCALLDIEKECLHRLGVEVDSMNDLQLPAAFVNEIPQKLPLKLTDNIVCYETGENHLLSDAQSQRDSLRRLIAQDFAIEIS